VTPVEPPVPPRCVLGARARGDELLATALPARRFVLLEVPGPWLPDAMVAAGLRPEAMAGLRRSVGAAGARLLLIRRPGRHPVGPDRPRRWGIAGGPGPGGGAGPAGGLLWGEWRQDEELLELDVTAALPAFDPAEQRPVALVCTHGRHDLCCAIEGRPVVAAAAADPLVDVWECSHLGGDRFAANLLWLPAGLLFGGLTAAGTGPLLAAARSGRVRLEHFRGRCGDSEVAQAAQWFGMRELAEDRPDEVVVERVEPRSGSGTGPGSVLVAVVRRAGVRYRLRLSVGRSEPAHLTCRARVDARVRTYRLEAGPVPI
jgi:hypothetical protein